MRNGSHVDGRWRLFWLLGTLFAVLACPAPASADFQIVTSWKLSPLPGDMSGPRGAATDASGNAYVADTGNDRIQKFNSSGGFLAQFGRSGTGNGEFTQPWGVATDSAGNMYVVDTGNQRIEKLDSTGVFVTQWGGPGSSNGTFSLPHGIATDAVGNVYVADTGNDRIQKFDSSGAFLMSWGINGGGNGQFDAPEEVATDAVGNVYVVDRFNARIQKFTSSGAFIAKWGSSGAGNGQFQDPMGIAVDVAGNVYVSEVGNNRIQKFTSSGTFLGSWGSAGSADGQFLAPEEVATDGAGNIYVADRDNSRIQKFDSSGNFLGKWGRPGTRFGEAGDVATDTAGNVYVLSHLFTPNTFRIAKFDASGSFLAAWGTIGNQPGQFAFFPGGITTDASGNVYVADSGNRRVQKFDSSGSFLVQWGSPGGGDGQFGDLGDVATDAAGNVYVADSGNNRIQKFTSSGTFLSKWGTFGGADGQFQNPSGIAIDDQGNVYVGERGNHRIQKFDSAGNFLLKWGTLGSADGQFSGELHVATDAARNLYVSDYDNNRVQKFDSSGSFLGKTTNPVTVQPVGVATSSGSVDHTDVYVSNRMDNLIQEFRDSTQGTIVVKKDALPDDPQDFDFTAGGGLSPTSFQLDDDSDPTLSNTKTFSGLPPGSGYSVSESEPAGWRLDSATCDDGSPPSNVTVSSGERVTCTFVNVSAQYYPQPIGASPLRAALVPAFVPCTGGGNASHQSPLSGRSCNPPIPISNLVAVGPQSLGFERMIVLGSGQCAPFDSSHCAPDFTIRVNITDVRSGNPTGPDYDAVGSRDLTAVATLPDYSGPATVGKSAQITDGNNKLDGGTLYDRSATVVPLSFPVPMSCVPTASSSIGSTCDAQTTANSLVPGSVVAGKRAIWELGQVQVLDQGADGVPGNGDDKPFEVQGVFVP